MLILEQIVKTGIGKLIWNATPISDAKFGNKEKVDEISDHCVKYSQWQKQPKIPRPFTCSSCMSVVR